MDLLTEEENQNWYAFVAAVAAAFVFAMAAGFLLEAALDDAPDQLAKRPRAQRSSFEPDEPQIVQAPWKINTHPSATFGKVSKKQRKALRKVSTKVQRAVRDVYDAMIVSRSQLNNAVGRWMTRLAARELRSRPPVPSSLKHVKTTRRQAAIGIDLRTRDRAAARVDITFKADQGKRSFAFAHRGTLWLERRPGAGWKVIAFNIDQRRRA